MSDEGAPARTRRRSSTVAYFIAFAIAVTTTVAFGWAGFWLGLVVLVFARTAVWGIPLIKLSYRPERRLDSGVESGRDSQPESQLRARPDADEPRTQAQPPERTSHP
jgi:hypothetical protein